MDEFEFLKELQSIEYDLLGLIRRMPLDFQSSYGLKASLEKAASEAARATHEAHIQQAIKSHSEELSRGGKRAGQPAAWLPRPTVIRTLKNRFDPQAITDEGNDAVLKIAKELGISPREIAC